MRLQLNQRVRDGCRRLGGALKRSHPLRFVRAGRTGAVSLLLLAAVACSDALVPLPRGDLAIVGGGDLVAVSVSRGKVVGRIGPIPEYKDKYAVGPDSSRLYVSSFDQNWPYSLSGVDTRSLRVVVQQTASAIGARSKVGAVLPMGSVGLAVSPDGTKLVMTGLRGDSSTWFDDSAQVVVFVDVASLTPVGVFGPFKGAIVALPGSRDSASQRVMLVGVRPGVTTPTYSPILILGGPRLTLVDSLQPGVPVGQVVATQDGRALFLTSNAMIYRFDLATRQLVDSVPLPSPDLGNLCVAPDGQRLYLTDFGDYWDFPGSGKVQVYDGTLHQLAPIDLGSGELLPPGLNDCAVSRDGRFLLVSSGTPSRGPLYGPQPGRLFVVDRATGNLVRTVEIGSYAEEIFAF